jgi:hypothetical protein
VAARERRVGAARWAPNFAGLGLTVLPLLSSCLPALGANLLDRVKNQEINQILRLKGGHSKVLPTPFALTRLSVADPDIADLILINEREIYINRLAPVSALVRSFTGAGSATTTSFIQGLSSNLIALGGWTAAGALDGLRQFGAQQRRPAGDKPPGRLRCEAGGGAAAPGRGQRAAKIRQDLQG